MNMEVTMRQAGREDAEQMLQLYNSFTRRFVGSASRTIKNFRRILRSKDNINWVALDKQDQVIGYVYARFDRVGRRGEFREIVVDPEYDFEMVAGLLVEKVNAAFTEKKACMIVAGSMRNPVYEKLFPGLGFFELESMDVFMYAILNVRKFFDDLSPVLLNRLGRLEAWSGLVQVECEGHSLFLEKTGRSVRRVVWTNEAVDFKVMVSRELLTRLVFGVADSVESRKTGLLTVDSAGGVEQVDGLLRMLFPKRQFLIMDYW